jgi:hypothetical protein
MSYCTHSAVSRKACAVLNSGTGKVRGTDAANRTTSQGKYKPKILITTKNQTRECYGIRSGIQRLAGGTQGWEPMHDTLMW